jgi:hypothetical protein
MLFGSRLTQPKPVSPLVSFWAPAKNHAPAEPETAHLSSHPNCPKRRLPTPETGNSRKNRACRPRKYSCSQLMRRVFSIDVLACPRCDGRMRILCAIHPPEAIRQILDGLGLPSRPPPIVRATLGREKTSLTFGELEWLTCWCCI